MQTDHASIVEDEMVHYSLNLTVGDLQLLIVLVRNFQFTLTMYVRLRRRNSLIYNLDRVNL